MIFKRINEDTVNCIITEEDLDEKGISLEDFFEKKKEAMEFLHGVVEKAVEEVDYKPTGSTTPMQITILPDHSISLTLSENNDVNFTEILKNITEKAGIRLPKDFLEELGDCGEEERLIRLSEYLNSLKNFASTLKDAVSKDTTKAQNKAEETINKIDKVQDAAKELNEKVKKVSKEASDKKPKAESLSADNTEAKDDRKTKLSRLAFNEYLYRFASMRQIIALSHQIGSKINVQSSLYRDRNDGSYYMIFTRDQLDEITFASIFTTCYEFGQYITSNKNKLTFVRESFEPIIKDNAVSLLRDFE